MNRRRFLQGGLAAATLSALERPAARAASAGSAEPAAAARIDTNVTLFQWPGRRLPHDDPVSLQQLLGKHGVTEAWAGTFEGILERDLRGANARLAETCARSNGRLLGFGSINPTLPDWQRDIEICHSTHRMRGIRLHPNYHGYTLAEPRFRELLGLAAARGLLIQLVCHVEDTRTQNPLLRVPDVDVSPLPDALAAAPTARILLLNSGKFVGRAEFDRLAPLRQVFFDTARVESVGGVGRLLRKAPAGKVVFGSHAPFFIFEAAVIKLFESRLTDAELRSLLHENPRALLAGLSKGQV